MIEGEVTLGVLVAFITYIRRFFNPLRELSQIYNLYQSAGAALDRISRYLDQEPEVKEAPAPDPILPEKPGAITMEKVAFAYTGGEPVLRHLDLRLEPGATLGLVGASGSGKTTLARLLLRLYAPTAGRIYWDDFDIAAIPWSRWRQIITLVPQEPFLFADSLEQNLLVANPGASRSQLLDAAQVSGLAQAMEAASLDLDTVVGPRGITLSGGQRQLVGLTRAFLRQPQAVVLDEPTSSVDALTEARLHQGMEELLGGRTGLVIAHRPQTLRLAPRVALLENGQISAEGTWRELQDQEPRFRQLLSVNADNPDQQ